MKKKRHCPKILIVESERYHRLLYKLELEDEGYKVLLTSNSQDSRKVAEREHIDLIVFDAGLAELYRISDMQKLVSTKRDTPLIINSIFPQYKDFFAELGAEGYVEKSSNLKELKVAIKNCLTRKRQQAVMGSAI